MESWHSLSSLAFTVLGFLLAVLLHIFRAGRSTGDMHRRIMRLEAETTDQRTKLDELQRSDAAHSAANAGAIALYERQASEFRLRVAETFATKAELGELERKTEAQLTKIDGKLDGLGDKMQAMPATIVSMIRALPSAA